MTREEVRAAHASALATAVRVINAAHLKIGEPEIHALDTLWLDLRLELHAAEQARDLDRGLAAIEHYEADSLRAIRRAAR